MHLLRITAGLAVTALASAALITSASAQTDDIKSRLSDAKDRIDFAADGRAGTGALRVTGNATTPACFTDPAGDSEDLATGTVVAYPRTDITRFCGSNDATSVSLSVQVASPSDPATASGWDSMGAFWTLEVNGDDQPDFDVYYLKEGVVVENAAGDLACEGTRRYDGTTYTASLPSSCLGNAASYRFVAGVIHDTDPMDPNAPVYGDFTDIAGPITGGTGVRVTSRLAGVDRYTTAVAISRSVFPDGAPVVYLARGDAFADALAGSPHEGAEQGPLLLTNGPGILGPATRTWLQQRSATVSSIDVLGGTAAVSAATLDEARRAATTP